MIPFTLVSKMFLLQNSDILTIFFKFLFVRHFSLQVFNIKKLQRLAHSWKIKRCKQVLKYGIKLGAVTFVNIDRTFQVTNYTNYLLKYIFIELFKPMLLPCIGSNIGLNNSIILGSLRFYAKILWIINKGRIQDSLWGLN